MKLLIVPPEVIMSDASIPVVGILIPEELRKEKFTDIGISVVAR